MVLHKKLFVTILLLLGCAYSNGQNIAVNMARLDGISLTPARIFDFSVESKKTGSVQIKGIVRYRNSNLNFSYTFSTSVHQGVNTFEAPTVHPQWQFSSSALQDLFMVQNIMPAGTYEYCVTVIPISFAPEAPGSDYSDCIFSKSDDVFLINLIDPVDKAILHEYTPMLSWMANYSVSNQLDYRIRIAEVKNGQNAVTAIRRNPLLYEERNVFQNSIVYPIYAKPLEKNKLYAWTVDAYYKGILLGGAETWQFKIVDDSLPRKAPETRSYIDIKRENGVNKLTAIGSLKLKYVLDDASEDMLTLELRNESNTSCEITPSKWKAVYGDNRYDLNLSDSNTLKHMETYNLIIRTNTLHEYNITFQYLDPAYIK